MISKKNLLLCVLFSNFVFLASAFAQEIVHERAINKLIELHQVKRAPGPYDWMAQHNEPAQTFEDFKAQRPVVPDKNHKTIYVTFLGDFDKTEEKIIHQTAEFMEIYFGLPVKFTSGITLSKIPIEAQRTHPQTGDHQILTRYVIDKLLAPRFPDDAYCLIAFTASDLWPGEGWNFVFGEASIENRVGVWSIYRNGDSHKNPEDYKLCLLRTLKTGTHEVGHIFGLHHCLFYECNMNGSNHRRESDNRPLELCPVCLKKLAWSTRVNLKERFEVLGKFCKFHGLNKEHDFYKASAGLIPEK